MSSKILNHIKKVFIAGAVIMICSANTAYGYTIGGKTQTNYSINNIFSRFFKKEQNNNYDINTLKIDLQKLKQTGVTDISQITDLIDKLPEGSDKIALEGIEDMFSGMTQGLEEINIKELLNKLIDMLMSAIESLMSGLGDIGNIGGNLDLGGLLGGLGGLLGGDASSLPVQAESIYMDAKTAVEFGGQDKAAKLHANVYMHVDANGNKDSDKWALLVHPFMLNGTSIAGSVGPYYYEKGYNIIAPDLRGFGDSEGSVALGCLESMDIYDWLVKLNAEYKVSQVYVHGISLGAATTNYLSGIDGFINNGPTKIATKIKPITELKVVGLVEDCGYVDMTEFASEAIVKAFSGLKENFDYYSKATNSLKYCKVPMMIIHGTSDTTVKPENAETIKQTLQANNVPVKVHMVQGGVHAFIVMGSNKEQYKEYVQTFIDNCEKLEETETKIEIETKPQKVVVEVEKMENETINVNNDRDFVNLIKRLLNFNR